MPDRILLVDDDQNLLDSLHRQLRKHFDVETALGPQEGLAAVTRRGPYAVIVSDLRMPVMDGIQFLANAAKLSPDSVRIMLTGNADLKNAIQAVNEGNIYRFLTKPCDTQTLIQLLDQGIQQYRLVSAEKELLEKTLKGSIQTLVDLLSLLDPIAFGRSSVIRRYAHEVAVILDAPELWKIDTAAMLSQIGCITLPETLLKKLHAGTKLTDEELRLYESHPKIAKDLLSHIPRIEAVVDSILYQFKHFDGQGFPLDAKKGADLPLGGRILKAVSDFNDLESEGIPKSRGLGILKSKTGYYDPEVLAALEKALGVQAEFTDREVFAKDLSEGMIFTEDVRAANGRLLIARGQEVSGIIIQRLKNFAENTGIMEPLRVRFSDEAK